MKERLNRYPEGRSAVQQALVTTAMIRPSAGRPLLIRVDIEHPRTVTNPQTGRKTNRSVRNRVNSVIIKSEYFSCD